MPLQAALAAFIEQGHLARHIRRMRRTYGERHQLVVSIVDSNFADCLVRIPSAAGIHVTGLLRPEVGRSDDEIVRLALRRGWTSPCRCRRSPSPGHPGAAW